MERPLPHELSTPTTASGLASEARLSRASPVTATTLPAPSPPTRELVASVRRRRSSSWTLSRTSTPLPSPLEVDLVDVVVVVVVVPEVVAVLAEAEERDEDEEVLVVVPEVDEVELLLVPTSTSTTRALSLPCPKVVSQNAERESGGRSEEKAKGMILRRNASCQCGKRNSFSLASSSSSISPYLSLSLFLLGLLPEF